MAGDVVVPQYTLTVQKLGTGTGTVAGNGIDCGATCDVTLDEGTAVTLTATPAAGSKFTGWGGACAGTGNCVVTVNAATSRHCDVCQVSATRLLNLHREYAHRVYSLRIPCQRNPFSSGANYESQKSLIIGSRCDCRLLWHWRASSQAATTVQVGASGKSFASSAVQCAADPTTGVLSPVVEAGLFNPKSNTRGSVSLNGAFVATVTAAAPVATVWLADNANTVVVSLNKKTADQLCVYRTTRYVRLFLIHRAIRSALTARWSTRPAVSHTLQ